MKNLQNITFSFKLSKSPLKMCIILFWISYLLFALQLIWFLKRFFRYTPSRACKTRSESRETNNPHTPPPPPQYIYYNHRIKKNITYINSSPSTTLWIFLRIFDLSLLQTSRRYLRTSALKLLNMKLENDATFYQFCYSKHFKWPSISQVLCYSPPLESFCWPKSNISNH